MHYTRPRDRKKLHRCHIKKTAQANRGDKIENTVIII